MDIRIEPLPVPPRRGGPTAPAVVVLVVALLIVAVVKPWGVEAPRAPAPGPSSAALAATGTSPTEAPAPLASVDVDHSLVADLCLAPTGWRLFATERWSDRLVRSWKSIEPVASADGPGDPAIPFFPESSQGILTLGYCAPVSGPDRPPTATTTAIHGEVTADTGRNGLPTPGPSRIEGAATDPSTRPSAKAGTWVVLELARVAPAGGASALGGAWAPARRRDVGPSSGEPAEGWPSGRYVFEIHGVATDGTSFSRWFGVVVDVPARD